MPGGAVPMDAGVTPFGPPASPINTDTAPPHHFHPNDGPTDPDRPDAASRRPEPFAADHASGRRRPTDGDGSAPRRR
jgi:hypothetical protein